MEIKQSSNRLLFLDSTRGLAALIVALAHARLAFCGIHDQTQNIFEIILNAFLNAESAVLYFFILSGYVLSNSILKILELNFKKYIIFILRRILRIYPAFLAALLFTFFIVKYFNDRDESWLSQFWNFPLDIKSLFKQALLVFRIPNDPLLRILPHDWTLSIEMALSFLLPLLALTARINLFVMIAGVYLSVKFLSLDPYVFDFSLGIFISRFWSSDFRFKGSKIIHASLALVLISLQAISPDLSSFVNHFLIHHQSWGLAILLIILLDSRYIQSRLSIKPLIFLGKISYSFYLFHFVLLYVFKSLFYYMSPALIIPLYLIAVLLISAISERFIERTFNGFSRRLYYRS